ncbi:MAG: hypothetical protein KFB93_04705 [Simkaniaceae bacterium]|jgi:hypothetical protein|nr:MAG: hypothetical protein KFB93_04705 [Simkaniaceae bacterium]
MKKALSITIALCVMLLNTPMYANDEAFSESEYDANEGYEQRAPLGYGSSSAASSTVSMSMVGWGLGLAIAIAIVAGVIHQSAATHSSSSSNTPS